MSARVTRLGLVVLAAIVLAAIPAVAEDAAEVQTPEVVAAVPAAPALPAEAAPAVPTEPEAIPLAADCNECFVSCPLTHYACCAVSCPSSCTCQPLSHEVPCGQYSFPVGSTPGSCYSPL